MIFIDTDVAIALRDLEPDTCARIAELAEPPVMSVMTRVELEGGVHRDPGGTGHRQQLLARMLQSMPVIYFEHADILAYGQIIDNHGFNRRLVIDRLIAAQAVTRDALLITRNASDFRRIEGLRLDIWPGLTPRAS